MRSMPACPKSARLAASLIELLVVVFIMGIMMALLMPALNSARDAATRTVCKNNLHQIRYALAQYTHVHDDLLPPEGSEAMLGGWTVEILPFLEEQPLYDELIEQPSLNPITLPSEFLYRPEILTCPSAHRAESEIPGVPVSHYVMVVLPDGEHSYVGDAPRNFMGPWLVGPEIPPDYEFRFKGPHRGGYVTGRGGAIDYFVPE